MACDGESSDAPAWGAEVERQITLRVPHKLIDGDQVIEVHKGLHLPIMNGTRSGFRLMLEEAVSSVGMVRCGL